MISPVILAAVLSFSALQVAGAAGAPVAFLTDVAGTVQVMRGGKTLPGKTGTPLFAGDKVQVVKGKATVFSATNSPQSVTAGKQVSVGAAGAASAPSVWKSVFNGMQGGFSRRVAKVPATMRPGSLQALTLVNTKILPGELEFNWSYGEIDAASRASYEIFIRDDAGFAWRGTTQNTRFEYPGGAPALQPGHRYYWIVTPINKDGQPDAVKATRESWFQFATVNEVAALEKDSAELKSFLKATPEALPLAQATLLTQRGHYDAAVKLMEPLVAKAGSARGEVLSAQFREALVQSKRIEQLARWYPNQLQLADSGGAASSAAVELPSPNIAEGKIAKASLKSYSDPGGLFRLSLPVRWGATRSQVSPTSWFTGFASMIGGKPDMSIITAPTKSLDGVSLSSQLFALCKAQAEFTEQPATDTTFNGGPARRIEWKWQIKPTPTQGYSVEFAEGENTYVISIGMPQEADADMQAAFKRAELLLPTFSTVDVKPVAPVNVTFDQLSKEMQESMAAMDVSIKTQAGSKTGETAPKTLAEAQKAFAAKDVERSATAAGSLERADTAKAAARLATAIAWFQWDAGQRAEAARWFERRDTLQRESNETKFKFHEAAMAKTEARLQELNTQTLGIDLAFAQAIAADGWRNLQKARNTAMQNAARESGDAPRQLKYALQELALQLEALDNNFLADNEARAMPGKRAAVSDAIESIGDAQQAMAAYAQAEKSYRVALDWRQTVPPSYARRSLDSPMRELAYLYFATGDNVQAREWYRKALDALDATAAQRKAASDAEPDEFLRDLQRAGDAQTYALIWNNLGILESGAGDLRAAEEAYNKALQAVEPLGQTGYVGWIRASMRATAQGNIATLRADSGEIPEAIKMGDEVIATRRALDDDEGTAFWLLNRSGLLYTRGEKGDKEEARSGVEQALKLFQASRNLPRAISAHIFLAKMDHETGNFKGAETHAREALKVARSLGNAEYIGSSARSLARIQSDQAIKAGSTPGATSFWKSFDALLVEANRADERLGSPLSTASTLYLKGKGLENRGNIPGAIEAYQSAIARLEAVRATARSQDSFADSEDAFRYYQAIVLALLKVGRADEAFDYLSRARSQKMRDSLRLSSIETNDKGLQTLLDLASTLEKKLGTVRAQLQTERSKPESEKDEAKIVNLADLAASTQAEFFKVSEQIKAANPNFEKVLTVKPRELKKAQRAIPEDTVLVQYAPLGDQLYIFVVTRDDLKIYMPKVSPEDLWREVRAYRAAIDKAQTDMRNGKALTPVEADPALKTAVTSLYGMLLTPIEGEIKKKNNIAFIPTGMLYYLPIHALAKETPQGLRYLVEDKRVAYLAAADVLSVVQTRDDSQFGSGMLALGDPSGANLPAAREEVNEIAKIYPASRALTGDSATKKVLQDAGNLNRRVLHLATHGVLDGNHPEGSYIQLAGGGEEGKLRMGEVYGLSLNQVDLVTLSACQTALGQKDPDGSEITSLAEAFSSAGPPSVMASLWSVEDESTRRLMESFYTSLAGGKSKGEALQQAQITLLKNKETSHPFFWAPFEVLGDWR